MTEQAIDSLNSKIYDEGKIYWEMNKGYTSLLWKRLYSAGWRMKRNNCAFISFLDSESKPAFKTGFTGVPYALKELARLMM